MTFLVAQNVRTAKIRESFHCEWSHVAFLVSKLSKILPESSHGFVIAKLHKTPVPWQRFRSFTNVNPNFRSSHKKNWWYTKLVLEMCFWFLKSSTFNQSLWKTNSAFSWATCAPDSFESISCIWDNTDGRTQGNPSFVQSHSRMILLAIRLFPQSSLRA